MKRKAVLFDTEYFYKDSNIVVVSRDRDPETTKANLDKERERKGLYVKIESYYRMRSV